MRPHLLFAPLMLMAVFPLQARDVQSLQPLLMEAFQYGKADGVLVGPIAETFARMFKTRAPLVLSVRKVAEISEACKRLEVTASQDGVWDRNSQTTADAPRAQRLVYQVSMCADGSAYQPQRPLGE